MNNTKTRAYVNTEPEIGDEFNVITSTKPAEGAEVEIMQGSRLCAIGQVVNVSTDAYTVLVITK